MSSHYPFSEVTPQIESLAALCEKNGSISPDLYLEHNVYCGLRDLNGKGVLTGLTEISEIISKKEVNGELVPCEGELYYRGYNVRDLIRGFMGDKRFGFEETAYLLLFGDLPDQKELNAFTRLIADYRQLPSAFVRDIVMKSPSADIMNTLARSILTLYAYDDHPNDLSIPNVLRQSLEMIAVFPMLTVYSYQAKKYYIDNEGLIIHRPHKSLSIAENILHLLRPDSRYTELEARVLDLALVLHAEHGGGNNSTFTMHVVTSSGTDTYSAVAAALSSLKGPKHGGANLKVCGMFGEMKRVVRNWEDEDEINAYLEKLLNKEAFDKSGLIYGMGHAVYSVSDPRAVAFKGYVERLAAEKQMEREFRFYSTVERLAAALIAKKRRIYKGVSANIDFYSGFCYSMLGLPEELYTPLFATARIAGWSAHRIEELVNGKKIIRPAYMNVRPRRAYVALGDR
ncbi:MAG: citrate/2-methylcitrate synthase [Bacteroides sp.]|nr:citrate/2-methylcitrate synthase [Eubacterium sp.]MCM1417568.1 citrate/2-methylcitrate synthase [Roseburia sp.]MCM1461721.1 citrate/2-methylcitrate synthase [Bacteroides sp.]